MRQPYQTISYFMHIQKTGNKTNDDQNLKHICYHFVSLEKKNGKFTYFDLYVFLKNFSQNLVLHKYFVGKLS